MIGSLDQTRRNAKVVAISGALLGVVAAFLPRGLILRENRIAAGDAVSLFSAFDGWGIMLVALWVACALLSLSPLPMRVRGALVSLLGGGAMTVCLWGAGNAATGLAASEGDIARTSLTLGFWLSLAAAYVVVFAATAWLEPGVMRGFITYAPVLAGAWLFAAGHMDALSIMREYANNAPEFWSQLRLHLVYVAGAVGTGLVAGLALGLLATRGARFEAAVFGVLNVLQVWPTLAFIGILYPVLTAAAQRFTVLHDLGVRGVGWAPVLTVLACYAVYPIARNVHAAVRSLDPHVVDAAKGVGMGRMNRLIDVELPLALPVIIAGVRVSLVQTTAGAIVAGLVGGGGLGVFVFLGAGQTATDLILLGVLPIVALALFFDRTVLALQRATGAKEVSS